MNKITALAAILAIPAMAAPAGYFQVPGTETTMKVYGKAETTAYYHLATHRGSAKAYGKFDSAGAPVVVPAVALGDQSFNEKGTVDSKVAGRIGVTTTTPSAYGDVNVKVEVQATSNSTDGNSAAVKLRHAYGEFHGLLIGQTDSLFSVWHNVPGYYDTFTPDFAGTGRSRQIRYTFAPADGFKLGFSMEENDTDGESTKVGNTFVAAGTYGADWGAVTASIGYQKQRDWSKTSTTSGNVTSFALSGAWNITENDSIQAVYLNGLGQHGPDFMEEFYEKGNSYKAYKNTSYGLGYTHNWGNGFDSSIGVGRTIAPKKTGVNDDKVVKTELFLNTNWQVTKNVKWGAEYYQATTKYDKTKPVAKYNSTNTDKYKDSMVVMYFQYNFF